jgi:predicted ABC-type ATPase
MLDLNDYGVSVKQAEWSLFWKGHGLIHRAPLIRESRVKNNILVFQDTIRSYEAAIISDFMRYRLLETQRTFSFETVFSHPSKLEFMNVANEKGYKCYLYFAAVSSPEISVARVKQRVSEGGHGVPEKKIRKRYALTLKNLLPAIRLSYRAYLFDNSQTMKLVAEMGPGQSSTDKTLQLKGDHVPVWLKEYVLDQLGA